MKRCPICKRSVGAHKEPSRCLDAWVSEFIMGWLPPTHPETKKARWEHCYHQDAYNSHFLADGRLTLPRPFSSSITHAVDVMEALGVLYFRIGREQCAGIRFDIVLYNDEDMRDMVVVNTEAGIAFAICKAALTWKIQWGEKKWKSPKKKS